MSLFLSFLEPVTQANAMVSSSAPSVYSVQALKLLAEVKLDQPLTVLDKW